MAAPTLLQLARETEQRLMARIDRRGPDECWPWTGPCNAFGYGHQWLGSRPGGFRRKTVAHRAVWALANDADPGALFVCHSCDNPPCCNPAHLFLGTAADNMADAARKDRVLFGEARSDSKLTEAAVVEIRREYLRGGITQEQLAARFGVSRRAIGTVVNGRNWRRAAGSLATRSVSLRRQVQRGERNGAALLSEDQANEIVALIQQGETQAKIAERFNVSKQTISAIATGTAWGSVTGIARTRARRLSSSELAEIRERLRNREPQHSIAARFQISQGMVSLIHTGKAWRNT